MKNKRMKKTIRNPSRPRYVKTDYWVTGRTNMSKLISKETKYYTLP